MFDREILAELRAIREELVRQTTLVARASGCAEVATVSALPNDSAWLRGLTPVTCPTPDLAALRPCLAGCQSHAPAISAPEVRNGAKSL